MIARLARWFIVTTVVTALLFGLVGRIDLPRLWAYAAICSAAGIVGVLTIDPEVAREKLRRGQKTADPVVLFLVRSLALAHVVAGAVDVGRLHWSDTVPLWLSVVGLVVMAAGFRITLAAGAANRFFVPAVRIQTERGHHVVDSGPYRHVRHPGYAGMILFGPASGFALGSWLAFGLGLAMALAFVYRAANEDRFLHENLEGYADYARRVRYRLIPRIW